MKLSWLWRHDAQRAKDGIVGQVQKIFHAIDVGDGSDGRWAAHLRTLFPQAEGWLIDEGLTEEGALRARKLFEEHMPELVPLAGPGFAVNIVLRYLLETCQTRRTADYQPKQRRVTYHWPGETWEESFDCYTTGSRIITLVDHR
jgi:hypothetical protein